MVLTADNRYAPCRGCLKCWLKQDGYCVYTDKLQHIGGILGRGDPLWIISRNCFGGYSSAVKAVLDRAIGVSLPFFTYRGARPTTSAAIPAEADAGVPLRGNHPSGGIRRPEDGPEERLEPGL